MTEYSEVTVSRILNPTSIDLGEFVINPFMGCEFACLYCYVRSNRVVSRKQKPWGEYVEARRNASQLLEKELALKKPGCVLLGSTTECFQPAEKKYRITQGILEVLGRRKVGYVILTRSPFILEYVPLLKASQCRAIYFTINRYSPEFKQALEPKTPSFTQREEAVRTLLEQGLPVVPYFSPVLPWVSELDEVFSVFDKAQNVEFECLNFRMKNIRDIIHAIGTVQPPLKKRYVRMLEDREYYDKVWDGMKRYIAAEAKNAGKKYSVYVHTFQEYFKNSYAPGR